MLIQTRTEKEVTKEELATRLELSTAQVVAFESGQKQLDFVQTRRWCLALGASFLDFMIDLDADIKTAELFNAPDPEPATDESASDPESTEGGAK